VRERFFSNVDRPPNGKQTSGCDQKLEEMSGFGNCEDLNPENLRIQPILIPMHDDIWVYLRWHHPARKGQPFKAPILSKQNNEIIHSE
jgi:hypothetical protein